MFVQVCLYSLADIHFFLNTWDSEDMGVFVYLVFAIPVYVLKIL